MDEPKRIVLDEYPLERLPHEVRERFAGEDMVTLTVERRIRPDSRRSISEILDEMQSERTMSDDPVKRIRALRAEWDHRDELLARIRRGETI